jgi:hypothetical protein
MHLEAVLLDMRALHADATWRETSSAVTKGFWAIHWLIASVMQSCTSFFFLRFLNTGSAWTQRCKDDLDTPYKRLTLRRLGKKCL